MIRPAQGKLVVLQSGVGTKVEALAHEALFAAKAIAADPCRVRGGPWLKPTLTMDKQLALNLVSKCTCVLQLEPVLAFLGSGKGKLAAHLGDVVFEDPRKQKQQTTSTRAKGQAKASRKAKPQAKAAMKVKSHAAMKAKSQPMKAKPQVVYIRRKRSGTPSTENGHDYRVKNYMEYNEQDFEQHKYGKKGAKAARHDWWKTYKPKRGVKPTKAKKAMR